jgi:nucleotide-binding universal stress UspA family protein
MAYKTILVHVEPDQAEARVRCALDLADRFGAVTIGCGSELPAQYVADPIYATSTELITLMDAQVDRRLRDAKEVFEHLAGTRDHRWISRHMAPVDALVQAAAVADLVVTSRAPKDTTDVSRHENPSRLAFAAGRPVLVAPPGKDYLAAARIVVCWNDTREARRAVADALPFLIEASAVLVVQVASPDALGSACGAVADVAESLRRQGVVAESEALIKDERRVFDIVRDRASAFGADLLVAGAYGHSRLGEWILGGMTRSLLAQDERFVLLSH